MARTGVCTLLLLLAAGLAQAQQVDRPPSGPSGVPNAVGPPGVAAPAIPPPQNLEQAWAEALAADRRLQAQQWSVSAADEAVQAAEAERWPVVGLEASYTMRSAEPAFKVHFEGLPLPSTTFPYAQSENFAGRAKVDVPLYMGGRIQHGIAAAEAERTATVQETEEAVMDLKLRVGEAYLAVLRAERDVELTESTVRSIEAHVRTVSLRHRNGQVVETELLAAQVALANAAHAAIQARNRLHVCSAAYNRHLGRELGAPVRLAPLPVERPPDEVQPLTDRALRGRPALTRLASQAESLRHLADAARAKNGPQILARGEYAYEENRFRTPEGIAGAGVAVSWNLFDGGRNRHEANALLLRAEALRSRQAELESFVRLEVRRAWLDAKETHLRLNATPAAVRQAEENLRVVRARYTLGENVTNTEVLDAETLRLQAHRNHDNAVYDAVLAMLRLRHAVGELREKPSP